MNDDKDTVQHAGDERRDERRDDPFTGTQALIHVDLDQLLADGTLSLN
ncbi:hypothetical protein J4573_05430 [Actinomadura barringtoniae]|uniref:Uncharacterized protein n=1 Tax=Actinomadura barringtoniae TaxID=1427535 RepID=A0A939PDK7_9ACTN|nr:hypothetical protein [Actinomadura barringtoniae]MBO2446521.1 hypothetical protein [Actinomadura barringtoniae]